MKTVRKLGAAGVAAALAVATAMPVAAAPIAAPAQPSVSEPFTLASSHWRGRDRDDRRSMRGYRGSRDFRRGYRRHSDGWWYPLAAFGIGAAIGSALAPQAAPPRVGGNAHTDWCYSRYRSYRAWDNTFQPYNGPRRQCHSPYG